MKDWNLKSLKEVLDEFSDQRKVKKPILEARIVNYWAELMGPLVDRYTEKIYVNNQTLFIKVGPDALKNELLYSQEKIISEMNLKVGQEAINKLVIL